MKNGRGASPLRAPETTWDQTGPTPLYKGQVNIIAGNNMFLTVRAGYVGNGFSFTPQGGLDATGYRDAGRVRHGSYVFYETKRPDNSVAGRRQLVPRPPRDRVRRQLAPHQGRRARRSIPGSGVDSLHATDFATTRRIQAWIYRPFFASSVGVNQSLYVGDTIRAGRADRAARRCATIAATRRCSRARRRANPGFPTLLPAIVAPAEDKMIDLSLLSPRAGVSYALDEQRPHAACAPATACSASSSAPARCRRSRPRRRRC